MVLGIFLGAMWGVVSLIIWAPIVALLLWAVTFVTSSITFSWYFVAIVSGVFGLITAFIAGVSSAD